VNTLLTERTSPDAAEPAASAAERIRKIPYLDGVEFEVADRPGAPTYFVLGVRKSGSSIVNNMLHDLAKANGVHYVDVAGTLFDAGMTVRSWQRDPELCRILLPGNLYGGFRNFPICFADHPVYRAARKVLVVRDPRDALVSEHFSDAYSHSIPQAGEQRTYMQERREKALHAPIEEHVLALAPDLKRTLQEYRAAAADPNLKIFKYKDMVLKKRDFLTRVAEHFGWQLSEQLADNILSWADVFPTKEDPTKFIRKVTPGDYREKLSPRTIAKLDKMLGDEMRFFGYLDPAPRRRFPWFW